MSNSHHSILNPKLGLLFVLIVSFVPVYSAPVEIPHVFIPNTKAKASEVNENFQSLKNAIQTNDQRLSRVEAANGLSLSLKLNQLTAQLNRGDILNHFPTPVLDTLACTPTAAATAELKLGGTAFGSVKGIIGYEELSQGFIFDVLVESQSKIAIGGTIGQPVDLSISNAGVTKSISGIVTRAGTSALSDTSTVPPTPMGVFTLRIEPSFSMLQNYIDYRIFSQKSVPDIAKLIANEKGITYFDSLAGNYEILEFEQMYNESYSNYIKRLLEREGIFFYYAGDVLSFGDSVGAYQPSGVELNFNGTLADTGGKPAFVLLNSKAQQNIASVTVDGFNFSQFGVDLSRNASASGVGEIYKFDELINNANNSQIQANIIMEGENASRVNIAGASNAPGLAAGYTFSVADNTASSLGGNYVATKIHHVLLENPTSNCLTYANSLASIPSNLVFRPKRTTPKPTIPGVVSAIVTGPVAGPSKYTDSFGRVKVQFLWDQINQADENSSGWVRVALPPDRLKDPRLYIPEIGSEVLISFVNGNPAKPVVTGTLYNSSHIPPKPLPQSALEAKEYHYVGLVNALYGNTNVMDSRFGLIFGTIDLDENNICTLRSGNLAMRVDKTTTNLTNNNVVRTLDNLDAAPVCSFSNANLNLTIPVFGVKETAQFALTLTDEVAVVYNYHDVPNGTIYFHHTITRLR